MIHGVLSVGGAGGVVQPWVIKTQGIEADAFYGSSVGALNAAMLATGQLDACLDLWDGIQNKDVFTGKYNALNAAWAVIRNKPILDFTPLRKLIDRHLRGKRLFHPLTVEYASFTGALYTHSRPSGHILDDSTLNAVYWSSAIPLVFPTTNYADGGLIRPIPLKPAIQAASPDDHIIVISRHPVRKFLKPPVTGELSKVERSLEIMQSALTRSCIEPFEAINALLWDTNMKEHNGLKRFTSEVYAPKYPLPIGVLDFDNAKPKLGKLLLE